MQQELFDPVSLAFGEQQVPIPDANIFASLDAFNAIKAARTLTQKSKEEQAGQADLLNKILTGEAAREAEARRNALGEQLAARIEELGKPLELSTEAPDIFDYLGGIAAGAISGDYGAAIAAVEASRKQREDEKNRQAVLDYESRQKALAYEMQTLTGDIEEAGRDYWRSLEMAAQQNRLEKEWDYKVGRDRIQDALDAEDRELRRKGLEDAATRYARQEFRQTMELFLNAKSEEEASQLIGTLEDLGRAAGYAPARYDPKNLSFERSREAFKKDVISNLVPQGDKLWASIGQMDAQTAAAAVDSIVAGVMLAAQRPGVTKDEIDYALGLVRNRIPIWEQETADYYDSKARRKLAERELTERIRHNKAMEGIANLREINDWNLAMYKADLDWLNGDKADYSKPAEDAKKQFMAAEAKAVSALDRLKTLRSQGYTEEHQEYLDAQQEASAAAAVRDFWQANYQQALSDSKRPPRLKPVAPGFGAQGGGMGGGTTGATLPDGTSYRIINPNPPGGAENTRISRGGQIASSQGRGGAFFDPVQAQIEESLGDPHVFGASSADKTDCSGLVCRYAEKLGAPFDSRYTTKEIFENRMGWNPVRSISEAQRGDVIVYREGGKGHAAILLGDGKILEASSSRKGVIADRTWQSVFGKKQYRIYRPPS